MRKRSMQTIQSEQFLNFENACDLFFVLFFHALQIFPIIVEKQLLLFLSDIESRIYIDIEFAIH